MGEKLVIGPLPRGLRNDVIPPWINNESFPFLLNAYQWRGRVKRKRGTSPICRLQRFFKSTSTAYGSTTSFVLDGSGNGNLLTGFNLDSSGNIVPGTVTFTDSTSATIYTDPTEDGYLTPTGTGGLNTINYATGAIHINGGAGHTITTATFNYYPDLPVMDIEDLNLGATQFPQTLTFDTRYSYQIATAAPYFAYDVSFYKNPAADATNLPAYVPKTTPSSLRWNGQNYQQFWSVNYENAMWLTNGITVPFTTTNISMQFKPIVAVTVLTATTANLQITGHGLVVGDFVFVNEVVTTTGINFQTGYVITVTDANNVVVKFPFATLATNGTGGIAQYLTSSVPFPTKDTLRWYDGDPTSGNEFNPTFVQGHGWVNFAPPISLSNYSLGDLPAAQYYLVGARLIFPYKDRLLFFGVVVQSSATGPFYLQDTVVFSQNGTPYYTASFASAADSDIVQAGKVFHPILTPNINNAAGTYQMATAPAYFEDVAGFGGFITAGYAQPITTVGSNQDVLIVGFTTRQTKLLYTGNDLIPFNFYIINSEYGATATFSTITLDRGLVTIGDKGFTITDQQSSSRIDLEIPDAVFEFDLLNNGTQRITSGRDFVNEWIYFTYPSIDEEGVATPFPNQTLFYNYRDQSWGVFNESYTTYGPFRRQTGFTWQTVGSFFSSWLAWNRPWNASSSSLLEPEVIAGNQQGFVVTRDFRTTSEAPSLYILTVTISSGVVTIGSPNHGLNTGDFVFFLDALGMTNLNSSPTTSPPAYIIWQVTVVDANSFTIASDPSQSPITVSGTYRGNGTITRLYVPEIQTKQFPMAWGIGRKTRIGPQQYLFTTTPSAQITLNIFLSQNSETPFNLPPYVPTPGSQNNSVVYSDVLYTCQESTNLGLTPANTNLQQQVPAQDQTWHRMNTSLIGDTVQVGFTLSPSQMFDSTLVNQVAEIELHSIVLDVSPSQMLS